MTQQSHYWPYALKKKSQFKKDTACILNLALHGLAGQIA